MSERTKLAEDEKPRKSRPSLIAVILIFVLLAGAYVSASYSRTLSSLQREKKDLLSLLGEMRIEDPARVAIAAVSTASMDLPTWVDADNVWVFRVHIPAYYGVSLSHNNGLIAADSPLTLNGGGGTLAGPEVEAREIRIVINTRKAGNRTKLFLQEDGGSTTLFLPDELAYDSPEDLVLDTVVTPGEPMRTFAVDGAVCLWRLRNKAKSSSMLKGTELYHGCAIYLHKRAFRYAFKRLRNGKSSSLSISNPTPAAVESE